jgi:hypothetical protein
MSFGQVDTLNMLFDKLESLFDESQGYYESFLDTNNMYKQGKIGDKEFFQRLGDYVVAYSALGQPGMMGSPGMVPPRAGTAENPVGGPPGIVSAQEAFGDPGTLPTPDPALMPRQKITTTGCSSCGSPLKPNAKFCTSCGNKL